MNTRQWQLLLLRDSYCLHCGEIEALAPNHRANRGMGGSKVYDVPSNIVLICSQLNGLLESDDRWHKLGVKYGWKVSKWDNWREIPVFDSMTGTWYLLNDDWTRSVVSERNL